MDLSFTHRSIRSLLVLLFFSIAGLASSSFGQQEDAAQFLPGSTAIYLHIDKPAELIETIETHPIVKYAIETKQIKELMRSPQFAMAMLGRGLLETSIDEPIMDALKTNLGNGLWVAVDPETDGVIVLFQSKDETRLKQVVGKLLKLASSTSGGNISFERKEYRDAVAAEFDNDILIARYKSWFAITNKSKLAKKVVDNMHDGATMPLAEKEWFKDAIAKRNDADLWAAVDMKTIREKVDSKELFHGRTDNPGVELILGGILDSLKHAPVALGELNVDDHISFSLSTPFQSDWADKAREYFFGEDLAGKAPLALKPKNMIANVTSYRDVGKWWLSKEELYAENVIAQLAQADSQLSTIFSGMDFGEDVLGALQPGVQIVVAENKYDAKYVPDVKMPAFALVGKLKDPQKVTRKLKIAFQSVIGFANINLGMNGQPQLEVETETIGDSKLVSSTYYYEEGTEQGLLLFNFAPSIAFKGQHLVISSTRDFAVELAALIGNDASETEKSNTLLKLDGQMLHKILGDNLESLIAQNMLEEGNSRKEAETQLEIVMVIADLFKDLIINYDVGEKEMKLNLLVHFEDVKPNDSAQK